MEKIQARLILEILGRPASNVTEALNSLVQRLAKENGVNILEQTIHEPISVKDSENLFTSFAELILELDSLSVLLGLMFAYMPAHAEVIKPESIQLKNSDLSNLLNILLQRLHNYDSIAKNMIMEKEMLTKKLFEVAPHLFKQPVRSQTYTPKETKTKEKKNKSSKKKK